MPSVAILHNKVKVVIAKGPEGQFIYEEMQAIDLFPWFLEYDNEYEITAVC